MMETITDRLSPSEKRTLTFLAQGEHQESQTDWVALQRLKRLGLAEEQSPGRLGITKAGLRALKTAQQNS